MPATKGYGTEWDVMATKPVTPNLSLTLKYVDLPGGYFRCRHPENLAENLADGWVSSSSDRVTRARAAPVTPAPNAPLSCLIPPRRTMAAMPFDGCGAAGAVFFCNSCIGRGNKIWHEACK
jgi:hypothetical protein